MFQTVRLMCVFALGAWLLPAQTVPVNWVGTTRMIGLAFGQTARLNLLNAGPPPNAAGVVCTATVEFIDSAGAVLKTTTPPVLPGKSMSVDLHSDTDLSLAMNGRREVRATVAIPALTPGTTPSPATSAATAPSCKLIPTLEVFDTINGRSQVVLAHLHAID